MATPWISSVRTTRRLRVFPASSVTRGSWRMVFARALREFNRLSGASALNVTVERVSQEDDAEVVVDTASGTIERSFGGADLRVPFSGTSLHGYTGLIQRDGVVERALIVLPSMPQVNTPRGVRAVGDGVRLVIAVHELVHACGLSNADHSSGDLFAGFPTVDAGTRPEDDVVRASSTVRMPPLVLSSATAGAVRSLWS